MRILKAGFVTVTALVFLAAAACKVTGADSVVAIFDRFGLPRWFMLATAVIETAGALLLLVPNARARLAGASLLFATMIAAAGFHFAFDPPAAAIPALVLAVATGLVPASNIGSARRGRAV